MNLKKLIAIKDSPLENLPSVSAILDTVMNFTEINPDELLRVLRQKEDGDFCMFKPDVFLKIATYAEGLSLEEFLVFSQHVRTAIRTCVQSVPIVHKLPLWFCKVRKNNEFMLAGLDELLQIKHEFTGDVHVNTHRYTEFQILHPEFFSTTELSLFMNFVSRQLSIEEHC